MEGQTLEEITEQTTREEVGEARIAPDLNMLYRVLDLNCEGNIATR